MQPYHTWFSFVIPKPLQSIYTTQSSLVCSVFVSMLHISSLSHCVRLCSPSPAIAHLHPNILCMLFLLISFKHFIIVCTIIMGRHRQEEKDTDCRRDRGGERGEGEGGRDMHAQIVANRTILSCKYQMTIKSTRKT